MSVPSHESTWTRGAPHMPASCRLNTWPASRMRIESKCGSKLSQQTGGLSLRARELDAETEGVHRN